MEEELGGAGDLLGGPGPGGGRGHVGVKVQLLPQLQRVPGG